MSFKLHLLIVSVIIALVYVAQLLMTPPPAAPVIIQAQEASKYEISIVRASWGLNCRVPSSMAAPKDNYMYADGQGEASAGGSLQVKENNILQKASELCNGKPKCDIPLDANVLGGDPLPSCYNKMIQVEYRCYAIDRLRQARSVMNTLSLDCEKQLQ